MNDLKDRTNSPDLSGEAGRAADRSAARRRPVVLAAAEAAELVQDGDTLLINGDRKSVV